ncbi:hypothetical protein AAHB34_05370 [Paenarthrobacter ureafaciens]
MENQHGSDFPNGEYQGKPFSNSTPIYPSGASFPTVPEEEAGITYSDPVDNARVPLIKLEDNLRTHLSPNFTVGSFVGKVGRDYHYARISVDLVRTIQAIQERAQAPLIYRFRLPPSGSE